MVLNYAECFNVYYCTDGYKLIDVKDGAQYLLVPDGKEAPDDLDSDVIVIHQPLERIYMAATSPMALFDAIDSLDTIRLSGETADNWYVQDAVDAMNAGTMIFAGKYSEPDYELLVSENCDLAIESTMILHSPKVQEMTVIPCGRWSVTARLYSREARSTRRPSSSASAWAKEGPQNWYRD